MGEKNVFEIALNTRFNVQMTDLITDSGIWQILSCLQYQYIAVDNEWGKLNPAWAARYLPALPADWEWIWLVQKGTYAGNFPKRVARYYFKKHGIKCPESFLSQIGNIARANCVSEMAYAFEFVDEFDWRSGDFGDSGSCYWGSHSGAREMMRENGGYAVRFYREDASGLGRAWFVKEGDRLVLWNGYGFSGDATLKIAQIMAAHFQMSYKKNIYS